MINNIFFNIFNISFCDVAENWQLGLQDPATPSMEGMINFHNYIMIFLISVGCVVLWMLFQVMTDFDEEVHPIPEKFTHSSTLEVIWTILPDFILPSFVNKRFGLIVNKNILIIE